MKKKRFRIKSEVWIYPGMSSNWHFVSIPKNVGDEIKKNFDTKARAYLLPIKAEVQKHENIYTGEKVSVTLEISV